MIISKLELKSGKINKALSLFSLILLNSPWIDSLWHNGFSLNNLCLRWSNYRLSLLNLQWLSFWIINRFDLLRAHNNPLKLCLCNVASILIVILLGRLVKWGRNCTPYCPSRGAGRRCCQSDLTLLTLKRLVTEGIDLQVIPRGVLVSQRLLLIQYGTGRASFRAYIFASLLNQIKALNLSCHELCLRVFVGVVKHDHNWFFTLVLMLSIYVIIRGSSL